ncbi:uncharacterized protein LOC113340988 [Papaver somniferum]|uniref:uncharacterized protein LOC113340988 n=1 Tax=Papaver somniferum TaxID=3469 RepID=UPI000E7025F4|nr:uncharacterized protein LOC113340988 [Papaver somniferum]
MYNTGKVFDRGRWVGPIISSSKLCLNILTSDMLVLTECTSINEYNGKFFYELILALRYCSQPLWEYSNVLVYVFLSNSDRQVNCKLLEEMLQLLIGFHTLATARHDLPCDSRVLGFSLQDKRHYRCVEFCKRTMGINACEVFCTGSWHVDNGGEWNEHGSLIKTQSKVAVLWCAFTMVKVFMYYTLVGILTWVAAPQYKLVHSQLLGLLIRIRGVEFCKRRVENRCYALLSQMCIEDVGERYWIMSAFVRNFLLGFLHDLHIGKYKNLKLEPSTGTAKQPSCGTIREGEAISTVFGGIYMMRAVEMRSIIHQLDTSASVYRTNDLKVMKDHYFSAIKFQQLKTLPLEKGRKFELLVRNVVVNPLTSGMCLRQQLLRIQGYYMEVNMKIHALDSTSNEDGMLKGAYTVNCGYNRIMAKLNICNSLLRNQWVVNCILKYAKVASTFITEFEKQLQQLCLPLAELNYQSSTTRLILYFPSLRTRMIRRGGYLSCTWGRIERVIVVVCYYCKGNPGIGVVGHFYNYIGRGCCKEG